MRKGQATIEKVVKNVVAIHFCQTCSFDTDTAHGGGHVAAVVVGPKVKRGYQSTLFYQHQSLVHTVLKALGVASYPGAAASAPAMNDLFF